MGEQTSSRIRVPNDSTVRFEVRQGQMAQIGGFSIPSTGKISIKLSSNDPEFSVSVDVPYFGVLGASKGTTSRKLQIPLVNEANSGRYAKNKLPIVHASMEIKDIDKEHLELIDSIWCVITRIRFRASLSLTIYLHQPSSNQSPKKISNRRWKTSQEQWS